ncbi:MAG: MerR family transcriptional regulator [Myxococcota bacterium]
MADPEDDAMTVEEVARRAGTTSRNVRSYQTKGLLPHPRKAGRVGLYDRFHLTRLKLIASMQERGYSLAAIGDLLDAWDTRKSIGEMLGLERALSTRYHHERVQEMSRAKLTERFPVLQNQPDLWDRVTALDLIVPATENPELFVVPSPRLLDVAHVMLEVGVPPDVALDELATLREQLGAVANSLVRLFKAHVWKPWVDAGRPISQLPGLIRKIRKLRPLPTVTVSAILSQAMDAELEATVGELLSQVSGNAPKTEP